MQTAVARDHAGIAGAEQRRALVVGRELGELGDHRRAGVVDRGAGGRGVRRAAGDAGIRQVGRAGLELDLVEIERRAQSAAIWANAVQAPWPMSCAPVSITPVPSRRITARASAANISAGNVAVPMPQPTRKPSSSRIWRGCSGRFDQPKRSAPFA